MQTNPILAMTYRPRLKSVHALQDYKLQLVWCDGKVSTVSLANSFDKFPGLQPLQDKAAFAKAQIIEDEGWTVEWPELDIQIGVDTLCLNARVQNTINNPTP